MKKLKLFLSLTIIVAGWIWVFNAHAAPFANVTVTVTIQSVSVSLSGTTWDIGTIAAGQDVQMSEASDITVTNSGNVPESFILRLTNPAGWTAGNTAGSESYVMKGLLAGAADTPAGSDFGPEDVITTASQTASATVFGYAGPSGANGAGVAPGGSADLWLLFTAPTSTSVTTQQAIVITIGATVP